MTEPAANPSPRISFGGLFAILFLGAWIAATAALDFQIVRKIVRQSQAAHYAKTEGTVVSCKHIKESDDEGTSHKIAIVYTYDVNGQALEGTRVAYLAWWTGDWVRRFVADHPAGKQVAVYYNPDDPSDAILIVNTEGAALFMVMFALPFNVVSVGGIAVAFLYWRGSPALDFVVLEQGDHCRIRLMNGSLVAGPLLALFAGGIPIVVIIGICCGVPPPFGLMVTAWLILLGSIVVGAVIHGSRISQGKYDIVIDRTNRILTLPKWAGTVEFAQIAGLSVESWADSEGAERFHVLLRLKESQGEVSAIPLADWSERNVAEELMELLRKKIS